MEADILVVPAWVYDGITPLGKIIDKFQYEKWFYIEKFWFDVCNSKKINCPKKRGNDSEC